MDLTRVNHQGSLSLITDLEHERIIIRGFSSCIVEIGLDFGSRFERAIWIRGGEVKLEIFGSFWEAKFMGANG